MWDTLSQRLSCFATPWHWLAGWGFRATYKYLLKICWFISHNIDSKTLKKCYLEVTQGRTSTWLSLGNGQISSDLSVCHLSGWWFRAVDTTRAFLRHIWLLFTAHKGLECQGGGTDGFGVQMVQGRGGHCVCVWVMCREIFSILLVCSRGPSC